MPATSTDIMEKDQKYTIQDASPRTEQEENTELPAYLVKIKLDDATEKRLKKEFFNEFDALKKERGDEKLEDKWAALANQYEGNMREDEMRQFNLHRHVTKTKVDTVVRYMKKAFLEPDPMFSVSPRPEFLKESGREICDKQADYLDYQYEDGGIDIRTPVGQGCHNALKLGLGLLKAEHDIITRKRKREEVYEGTPEYIYEIASEKGPLKMRVPLKEQEDFLAKEYPAELIGIENKGLEEFLKLYPTAAEEYKGYVSKLERGEKIEIVVEYEEITYNNPKYTSIDPINFYARVNAEGYQALIDERLTVERMNMSWWHLKGKEKKGEFESVDALRFEFDEKGNKKTKGDEDLERESYDTETYDILEGVFYFKIKEEDEDYTRIVCWFDEESKVFLGARYYPYYSLDAYYYPIYISDHRKGFYKASLAEYLTDNNVAENAILNFLLEGLWASNMVTPIVDEDSDIADQFASNTWAHGMPLIRKGETPVDFLNNHIKAPDVGGLIMALNVLARHDDDVSGVSSYVSGRESPLDPEAPAKKTLALLKQSGINIEEYVRTAVPAINWIASSTLSLTHQMSLEGKKYRPRAENITGEDPFSEITRSEMRARTNIQSQAVAFNVDRMVEKELDIALYGMLRKEPMIARNPQAVWVLLKNLIQGWSPKWRNLFDQILPTPKEMNAKEVQAAITGFEQYVMQKQAEVKAGMPVEPEVQELVGVIGQKLSQVVNPTEAEDEQGA